MRWQSTIKVNDNSVIFTRSPSYHPTPDKISKRSIISGFSRHSRKRLRELLATSYIPDSDVYGLTLTLPWVSLFPDVIDVYQQSFNRFGVIVRRLFPSSAFIFRHELQTRKMPHTHLIFYYADLPRLPFDNLYSCLFSAWYRSIVSVRDGNFSHFLKHGIKLDLVDDSDALFRYLADHSSKHKQAQLGYSGKQWGVINRKSLKVLDQSLFTFRFQNDLYSFQRLVSKLSRFRIKSDCVFGSKLSHRPDKVSINFISKNTLDRLLLLFEKKLLHPIDNEKNF